jgi:hypothetical protein
MPAGSNASKAAGDAVPESVSADPSSFTAGTVQKFWPSTWTAIIAASAFALMTTSRAEPLWPGGWLGGPFCANAVATSKIAKAYTEKYRCIHAPQCEDWFC